MTAPDLADVIAEVNRLRAERDLPPLNEMPKGVPGNPDCCPVACAIEGWASLPTLYPGETYNETSEGSVGVPTPRLVERFMAAFDRGAYPDLIDAQEGDR